MPKLRNENKMKKSRRNERQGRGQESVCTVRRGQGWLNENDADPHRDRRFPPSPLDLPFDPATLFAFVSSSINNNDIQVRWLNGCNDRCRPTSEVTAAMPSRKDGNACFIGCVSGHRRRANIRAAKRSIKRHPQDTVHVVCLLSVAPGPSSTGFRGPQGISWGCASIVWYFVVCSVTPLLANAPLALANQGRASAKPVLLQ